MRIVSSEQIDQLKKEEELARAEAYVKQHMTREALVRYGAVKTAYPERAYKAFLMLAKLLHEKQLITIDEETVKNVLQSL